MQHGDDHEHAYKDNSRNPPRFRIVPMFHLINHFSILVKPHNHGILVRVRTHKKGLLILHDFHNVLVQWFWKKRLAFTCNQHLAVLYADTYGRK